MLQGRGDRLGILRDLRMAGGEEILPKPQAFRAAGWLGTATTVS